ncbi:MAG: HAD family phosphatase [Pseudomonadota bacterium]|nr:HAD family phosphatase [Pseudomonadota bacterium]
MHQYNASTGISAIVFDFGGVLMDWNPRNLYRKLFNGDDMAMENFLTNVCTEEWIRQQDMGLPVAEAVAQLVLRFPDQAPLIEAYDKRWPEILAGPIDDSISVLTELRQHGVPLYGLTNLPGEKLPVLEKHLDFLEWFEAVVVSGAVGIAKPDAEIYTHLLKTCFLTPESTLYIDDVLENVEGAMALGLPALQFVSPAKLRSDLVELALL